MNKWHRLDKKPDDLPVAGKQVLTAIRTETREYYKVMTYWANGLGWSDPLHTPYAWKEIDSVV